MKQKNLDELFMHELEDIYDAEHQLVETLPKMAKAATNPGLVKAFESHLEETKGQIKRLRQVFEACGESPKRETCKAMKGLVEEGSKVIEDAEEGDARDAGLIAAAQKVEHYEIATYGTLITWARTGGYKEEAKLLEQNLAEEKTANMTLTNIAEDGVNEAAEAEESEEDEGEEVKASPKARKAAAPKRKAPARSRRAAR